MRPSGKFKRIDIPDPRSIASLEKGLVRYKVPFKWHEPFPPRCHMAVASSLADIAKATGFSVSTVSLALRGGMGKIKPETCERIRKAALELGYRPNGAAAMLAMQRHRPRRESDRMLVASLNGRSGPNIRNEAFERHCSILGLENRRLTLRTDQPLDVTLRIAWNTGVEGICLMSDTTSWTVSDIQKADWSRFAVVRWGRHEGQILFDTVRQSPFDYMLEALRQVFGFGYKNVGVLMLDSACEWDDLARMGAIRTYQDHLPQGCRLNVHCATTLRQGKPLGPNEVAAMQWIEELQLDAVLVFPFSWYYRLVDYGFRIPQDFGVASVFTYQNLTDTPNISGCDAAPDEMGEQLAEHLFRLMRLGVRGLPKRPWQAVIPPRWLQGETLPRIAPAEATNGQNVKAERDGFR